MSEFSVIDRFFRPLVHSPRADRLNDDVAVLGQSDRKQIITTDALIEGVHFLPTDPLHTVAYKLLAVNVSDILAKGAHPSEALLTLVWPKGRPTEQIECLADGLRAALGKFDVALIGGDTVSIEGPLVLSLTLIGRCVGNGPVRRSGARPGDDLWVSGRIGTSVLGLKIALGKAIGIGIEETEAETLLQAYRMPTISPSEMADLVARHATASIDVSDGLLADAEHIARQSGVSVEIEGEHIPICSVGKDLVETNGADGLLELVTGGDDYQALFTVPTSQRAELSQTAHNLPVSRIGRVTSEGNAGHVRLFFKEQELEPESMGWQHSLDI